MGINITDRSIHYSVKDVDKKIDPSDTDYSSIQVFKYMGKAKIGILEFQIKKGKFEEELKKIIREKTKEFEEETGVPVTFIRIDISSDDDRQEILKLGVELP